jgi:transposase
MRFRSSPAKEVNSDKPDEPVSNPKTAPIPIRITYGYSRDHRPDLKQFILDESL